MSTCANDADRNIRNLQKVLENLKLLPLAQEVSMEEIFIDDHGLCGRDLGIMDLQILASAVLSEAGILTLDRAMLDSMKRLKIREG